MRLRLPMLAGNRSLNLSNAVAVVVFEAWRQIGFLGLGLALLLRIAREQLLDRGLRRELSFQHGVHRIGDRHVDAARPARASPPRARSRRPRRRGRGPARILSSGRPRASCSPTRRLRERSPVAVRIRSPAPVRPKMVSARAAQRGAEARDLGQAARDERGARVVAEAEAVGDAGGDRHHVLHRAADLDADQVGAVVDAHPAAVQQRGRLAREARRRARRASARTAARAPPRRRTTGRRARRSARRRRASARRSGAAGARVPCSKPLHSQTSGSWRFDFLQQRPADPATGVAARNELARCGSARSDVTFTAAGISMPGR